MNILKVRFDFYSVLLRLLCYTSEMNQFRIEKFHYYACSHHISYNINQ